MAALRIKPRSGHVPDCAWRLCAGTSEYDTAVLLIDLRHRLSCCSVGLLYPKCVCSHASSYVTSCINTAVWVIIFVVCAVWPACSAVRPPPGPCPPQHAAQESRRRRWQRQAPRPRRRRARRPPPEAGRRRRKPGRRADHHNHRRRVRRTLGRRAGPVNCKGPNITKFAVPLYPGTLYLGDICFISETFFALK